MNRYLNTVAAVAMAAAGIAGYVRATDYRYTTIDYPALSAGGINDSGQIVGSYEEPGPGYVISHAFILSGGVYTSFDHPNASFWGTMAGDINSLGQIVGTYSFHTPQGNQNRGYLRTGDHYVDLVFPGDPGNVVWGLNDLGQAVGSYYSPYPRERGFFFDGASYTLIDYPGATWTVLQGINNSGSMVGWSANPDPYIGFPRGFLLEDDTFTPIDVPGSPASVPTGINERGDIVGVYGPSFTERRAFVLSGGNYSFLHVPGALDLKRLIQNPVGHREVLGSPQQRTVFRHPTWRQEAGMAEQNTWLFA